MIKELLFKDNIMVKDYPKLGESIVKVEYHKKGSNFGIEHGIEDGGYCIHFGNGDYHVIPKEIVAVAIYE